MNTYQVIDQNGTVHIIKADFAFEKNGELFLKEGDRGTSELVAQFIKGGWIGFLKLQPIMEATIDAINNVEECAQ